MSQDLDRAVIPKPGDIIAVELTVTENGKLYTGPDGQYIIAARAKTGLILGVPITAIISSRKPPVKLEVGTQVSVKGQTGVSKIVALDETRRVAWVAGAGGDQVIRFDYLTPTREQPAAAAQRTEPTVSSTTPFGRCSHCQAPKKLGTTKLSPHLEIVHCPHGCEGL